MKTDIVCGMTLISTYNCEFSKYDGNIYYFCCRLCKEEFDENPLKFISELVKKNINNAVSKENRWERDPVCGDMVIINEAKAMSIFKGTKYYFCCPICKKEFDKNPSVYADKVEGDYDPQNPDDLIEGRYRIL